MSPSCALCSGPATIYCVNDDASLCKSCDVKFHSNPLTARHERRPVSTPETDRLSAAALSSEDIAVVPSLTPRAQQHSEINSFGMVPNFAPTFLETFSEQNPSFSPQREMSLGDILDNVLGDTDDLLDFCINDLGNFANNAVNTNNNNNTFNMPAVPDVVFGQPAAAAFNPFSSLFMSHTHDDDDLHFMVPQMIPEPALSEDDEQPEEEEEEDAAPAPVHFRSTRNALKRDREVVIEQELSREERVARYREKRSRRNFRKTVRYESRKAYAEIRPRIKGRFVSPEEYAAYMAEHSHSDVAVVPVC